MDIILIRHSDTFLFCSLFNNCTFVHFITKSNKILRVEPICDVIKKKRIHLTCRKKAFSPIWTAMKTSLRQDAEHRNPKVDLGWSLFSSGVCWHLPVPSAIIKKTSVFPPVSWLSVSGIRCYRSRDSKMSSPHPLRLQGIAISFSTFYAGRLSFLPFNTEGQENISEQVEITPGLTLLLLPYLFSPLVCIEFPVPFSFSRVFEGNMTWFVLRIYYPWLQNYSPFQLNKAAAWGQELKWTTVRIYVALDQ